MLIAAVNLLFAVVCLLFARMALLRGLPFVRLGWLAVSAAADQAREQVESRRTVSEGAAFLISGVVWLVLAAGAVLVGVVLGWQGVMLWLDPPSG